MERLPPRRSRLDGSGGEGGRLARRRGAGGGEEEENGRRARDRRTEGGAARRRVKHRGATAADRKTGDGAGLLLPIPQALVPAAGCGLAMVFLREDVDREAIEEACRAEGLEPVGWRAVPVDPGALGTAAQ